MNIKRLVKEENERHTVDIFLMGVSFSLSLQGVVPEPPRQVEEEGALRADAAGPHTLLHGLRAAPPHTTRELRTGTQRSKPVGLCSVIFSDPLWVSSQRKI